MVAMEDVKVVSEREPSEQELNDLLFAWEVAKYVKSNAIVYAKAGRTIGVGAGQMSRVYSARIAGIKAADEGLEVKGSVMASDAFFPFADGLITAAEAGATALIQPGGSMRDDEVIAAAGDAMADAGVALSCNLAGQIFVNQSAAFSDFHVSGANPAGNATLCDGAFVAIRFRIVASRIPAPAPVEATA